VTVSFTGKNVAVNGRTIEMALPVRSAAEYGEKVFVLLDPNSYLTDRGYKLLHPRGTAAVRNLLALSNTGEILWEGEFPQSADYYYSLKSLAPLIAYSFSSYSCEIDSNSGRIIRKEFFK
jgi:hypothetical protein